MSHVIKSSKWLTISPPPRWEGKWWKHTGSKAQQLTVVPVVMSVVLFTTLVAIMVVVVAVEVVEAAEAKMRDTEDDHLLHG